MFLLICGISIIMDTIIKSPIDTREYSYKVSSSNLRRLITPGPALYYPRIDVCITSPPHCKMCKSTRQFFTQQRTVPAPGTYNIPTTIGYGPKIALYGKRPKDRIECIPGPGAYNVRIKDSCAKIVISTAPKTAKDFSTHKGVPGPGAYSVKLTLNGPKFRFG